MARVIERRLTKGSFIQHIRQCLLQCRNCDQASRVRSVFRSATETWRDPPEGDRFRTRGLLDCDPHCTYSQSSVTAVAAAMDSGHT